MKTMKILLTLTLMGMVSVLYGQTNEPYTDMSNANGLTDTVTGGFDSVPYYVVPDPVLNSGFIGGGTDYDPTAAAGGNTGIESTWEWGFYEGVTNVTDSMQGPGVGAGDGPYVEVKWSAPGGGPAEDTIYAQETGSAGCPGDSTYLPVRIVDPPAFTPWDQADIEICETAGAQNVELNTIADNFVSGGNLKIRFDVLVDSVDPALNPKAPAVRTSTDTIATIAEVAGDGTDDNNVVLLTGYSMPAVNGQITRYQFDFASGGNGGINDHISRKTEYLDNTGATEADFTFFTPTDAGNGTTITYIVYPTPETGDIFFIPNDWNN